MSVSPANVFTASLSKGAKRLVNSIAVGLNEGRFAQIQGEDLKAAIFLETLLMLNTLRRADRIGKTDEFLQNSGFYPKFRQRVELLQDPNKKKEIGDLILLLPGTSQIQQSSKQSQGFSALEELEVRDEQGSSSSAPKKARQKKKKPALEKVPAAAAPVNSSASSSSSASLSGAGIASSAAVLSIEEAVTASSSWATASTAVEENSALPAPAAAAEAIPAAGSFVIAPLLRHAPVLSADTCPLVPVLADPGAGPVKSFNAFLEDISRWDHEMILRDPLSGPPEVFFMTEEGLAIWRKLDSADWQEAPEETFEAVSEDLSQLSARAESEAPEAPLALRDYRTLFVLTAFYSKYMAAYLDPEAPSSEHAHWANRPIAEKRLAVFRDRVRRLRKEVAGQKIFVEKMDFSKFCRHHKLVYVVNEMLNNKSYNSDRYYGSSDRTSVYFTNFGPSGAGRQGAEFLGRVLPKAFPLLVEKTYRRNPPFHCQASVEEVDFALESWVGTREEDGQPEVMKNTIGKIERIFSSRSGRLGLPPVPIAGLGGAFCRYREDLAPPTIVAFETEEGATLGNLLIENRFDLFQEKFPSLKSLRDRLLLGALLQTTYRHFERSQSVLSRSFVVRPDADSLRREEEFAEESLKVLDELMDLPK